MNLYPYPSKCPVCRKSIQDASFCSRACALEQQRRELGATVEELVKSPKLKVQGKAGHGTNIQPFRERFKELTEGYVRVDRPSK